MRISSKQDIAKDVSLLWIFMDDGDVIMGTDYVVDGIAFKVVRILDDTEDEIEVLVKLK